jgi:hypothetical protein
MVAEEIDVSGRVGKPVNGLGGYTAIITELYEQKHTSLPGELVPTCLFASLHQSLGRASDSVRSKGRTALIASVRHPRGAEYVGLSVEPLGKHVVARAHDGCQQANSADSYSPAK